jgi:hypothetical protein
MKYTKEQLEEMAELRKEIAGYNEQLKESNWIKKVDDIVYEIEGKNNQRYIYDFHEDVIYYQFEEEEVIEIGINEMPVEISEKLAYFLKVNKF